MKKIIERILNREELQKEPVVLFDIGASGGLNPEWDIIAPYSICVTFDPDERDIDYIKKESGRFRELYHFNAIVTDTKNGKSTFYLTEFPYCSSTLKPDSKSVQNWFFADYFNVIDTVSYNAVTIQSVLKKLNIKQVDWFKTDSQGTDLRLFKSMGSGIINKVILAEFEPGILDSYIGEDKLHQVMQSLDNLPFWMCDMRVKGVQRIAWNRVSKYFDTDAVNNYLRTSPGWAEVVYLNDFSKKGMNKREFFLGIVFSIIKNQYGFALELAIKGHDTFNDDLFVELRDVMVSLLSDRLFLSPDKDRLYKNRMFRYFFSFKNLIRQLTPPVLFSIYRKLKKNNT